MFEHVGASIFRSRDLGSLKWREKNVNKPTEASRRPERGARGKIQPARTVRWRSPARERNIIKMYAVLFRETGNGGAGKQTARPVRLRRIDLRQYS